MKLSGKIFSAFAAFSVILLICYGCGNDLSIEEAKKVSVDSDEEKAAAATLSIMIIDEMISEVSSVAVNSTISTKQCPEGGEIIAKRIRYDSMTIKLNNCKAIDDDEGMCGTGKDLVADGTLNVTLYMDYPFDDPKGGIVNGSLTFAGLINGNCIFDQFQVYVNEDNESDLTSNWRGNVCGANYAQLNGKLSRSQFCPVLE
jgi:hypothetical protein